MSLIDISILCKSIIMLTLQNPQTNSITIDEFHFTQVRIDDRIHFRLAVEAPGWILLGFNLNSEIMNSYLVFGREDQLGQHVEDHFVVAHGRHESLFELGEGAGLKDCSVSMSNTKKELRFSLPIKSVSDFSPDFTVKKEHFIWLAYSTENDFNHHSRKRIGKWIAL